MFRYMFMCATGFETTDKATYLLLSSNILRLGAQSVTLLSTLRDPTQLRRRQWACTCYAMFEWKKTQILITHQKQRIDRTKKVLLADKKSSARD